MSEVRASSGSVARIEKLGNGNAQGWNIMRSRNHCCGML